MKIACSAEGKCILGDLRLKINIETSLKGINFEAVN